MTGSGEHAIPSYLARDLKRMMIRVGANEGWFRQAWLGVPIWQLPQDLVRLQSVVMDSGARWIVETGTKFGGSAIFFASLLRLLGREDGGVLTVDIHTTDEARTHLAEHPHSDLVRLAVEGDAASQETVDRFKGAMAENPGPVLVFLDDNHNADHVHRELELYSSLIAPGGYMVVADTVFQDLAGTPVGASTDKYPDVAASNPRIAVDRFLSERDDFKRDMRYDENGFGNFDDGFLIRTR